MTKEDQIGDHDWLPSLILLEDHGGDWEAYIDAVYEAFALDFIASPPKEVFGKRFSLRGNPFFKGREYTFWHMTSEGKVEEQREPDIRRCEKIRWARAIINAAEKGTMRVWQQERNGGTQTAIALPDFSYLVIFANRSGYVMLITAYPIEREFKRREYRKEYESYTAKMAETAPERTVS